MRGTLVLDTASGQAGVLMDVMPYAQRPGWAEHPTAFLRPAGGGPEWCTDPRSVSPLPEGARTGMCVHLSTARGPDGKTRCAACRAQLYL
nr:hypothetical protein [Streptomyces boncukensis]